MQKFPRTTVGGVSVSRMIIGTNWFMGYSHTTAAKDQYINQHIKNVKAMAEVLEVFIKAGVDTIMGQIQSPPLHDAVQETQQRTGQKLIIVSTPGIPVKADSPEKGFPEADLDAILAKEAKLGATFCLPHQSTTDALLDRCSRKIRKMDQICAAIRRHGMIPGLSTHMPESITYADESNLDVETAPLRRELSTVRTAVDLQPAHRQLLLEIQPQRAGHGRGHGGQVGRCLQKIGVHDHLAVGLQNADGPHLIRTHEAAVPHGVGAEDNGELPVSLFSGQGDSPS